MSLVFPWIEHSGAQRNYLRRVEQLLDDLSHSVELVGPCNWALRGPHVYGRTIELGLMLQGDYLVACGRANLLLDRNLVAQEAMLLLLLLNDNLPHASYRIVRRGEADEAVLGQVFDLRSWRSRQSLVSACQSLVDEMQRLVTRLYAVDLLDCEFFSDGRR